MHSIDRNRQIRELELFLFGGAAEIGESDWEQDINVNPFSPTRVVRRDRLSSSLADQTQDGPKVGTVEFDDVTKTVIFHEFE